MKHTDRPPKAYAPKLLRGLKSVGLDPLGRGQWLMPVVWTLLLAVSLGLNISQVDITVQDLALVAARTSFQRDILIRQWAANHGGVYVPMTAQTPPNPYLANIPERDILTPSGRPLTLMNPAYITRQLYELGQQTDQHSGHITSLKPIRPENAPDAWERQALEAFERGVPEVSAIQTINGEPRLRLMRPLVTAESCLPCHAAQGYKVGDIRGGISEVVPIKEYEAIVSPTRRNIILIHGGFWALGLGLMVVGLAQIQRRRRESEHAALAVRESEARFRSYFELPLAGRAITSPDKGWLDVNTTLCEMLGYTNAELMQMTWSDVTYPDDIAADQSQFERVMAGEIDGYSLEKRFIRKDGQIVHAELAVQCLRRPDRTVDYFVALIQDITQRKQADEALHQSEGLWRSIVKTSPDGICIITLDGVIRYASDKLLALHGYSRPEELLGQNIFEFLDDDYRAEAAHRMQNMLAGRYPGVTEYKVIRRDGSRFYAEVNAEILRDVAGRPTSWLLVERDVDQRKRAEEALRRQNQYRAALQETTLELSAQLDLDQLFENIVTRAAALVDADGGFFDAVDPATNQLVPRIGVGVLAESLQHAIKPGDGVAGLVWQTGQPLVINDYDHWTGRVSGYSYGILGSLIGVPLLNNGATLGVLGLAYAFQSSQTFGPEAIDLLTQFARLAAIAINNAQLFETVQQELRERAKAEEALRQSDARYRSLFDDSPLSLWEEDFSQVRQYLDTLRAAGIDDVRSYLAQYPDAMIQCINRIRVSDVNQATLDLLGVQDKQAVLTNLSTTLATEALTALHDEISTLAEGALRYSGDEIQRDSTGRERIISVHVSIAPGCAETWEKVLVSIVDVTERKRTENAEREQRVLAEALRDTAAALNSTLDPDEVLDRILVNVERVVPHDAANIMLIENGVAHIVRHRGFVEHGTGHLVPDAHFRVEDVPNMRYMLESGRPLAIPTVRDYPGWLDTPEIRWAASHVGAPLRLKGQVIGFLNLDTATPGFYTPLHAERLQAFADQAAIAIENARLMEAEQAQRQLIQRHSQQLEARVQERTAELQAANQRLTELDRLKDEFLSRISHELRTPLSSILIYLELLGTGRPDKREDYLATLKQETRRLQRLIEDVLEFSQFNLAAEQPGLDQLNLNHTLEGYLTTWERWSAERSLAFQLDLQPGLPPIQSNSSLIIQALNRLIGNAVNYTASGSVTVTTRQCDQDGASWLTISVQDTGPGIGADELPRIFERFYRGRAAANYKTPGAGLGLTIAQEIVTRLKGRITVESLTNAGSTFTIWLPVN